MSIEDIVRTLDQVTRQTTQSLRMLNDRINQLQEVARDADLELANNMTKVVEMAGCADSAILHRVDILEATVERLQVEIRNQQEYAQFNAESLLDANPEDCVECGQSSARGSGRFVNRVPAQTDLVDSYMCGVCVESNTDVEISD